MRIGFGDELPEIPSEMFKTSKDFLRRCFVKDSESRWTADMLLKHPFVADTMEDGVLDVSGCVHSERMSPRSVFSLGYVMPEYANTRLLNEKSDIYSFGVVLLEAITGRDHVDYGHVANEVYHVHIRSKVALCMESYLRHINRLLCYINI